MVRTALVLSAGGMFGAYQAGAWKVLADYFEPDLVVGASIGAINGWMIAGRCDPDTLIETWLQLDEFARYRFRIPRKMSGGIIDSKAIETRLRKMHSEFTPQIEYGAVVTDSLQLRPRVVHGLEVTWQHLAASAAILGFFDQHRIEGRLYSDGGLLGALPLWAAAAMGAERIVAVNALPHMPSVVVRKFVGALRAVSRFRPETPDAIDVVHIAPSACLGSAKDALYWKRENAKRWIEQGSADALGICASTNFTGREVHV